MKYLLADKDEIIANFALVREALFSITELEAEAKELQNEMTAAAEMIQKCIDENARIALEQAERQQRYSGLVERFGKAKLRYEEVSSQASGKKAHGETLDAFITELGKQERLIAEFDERPWYSLVDCSTVYSKNDMRLTFRNALK